MNLYSKKDKDLAEKKIKEEIEKAFEHAISSSNPQEMDLYTHVYSQ